MQKKRTKRNIREHDRLLVWVFAGFALVVFLLNFFAADIEYSDDENRPLAQRPEATDEGVKSGEYFSDYDSYYEDQFFDRSGWMRLRFRLSYLAGRREFDGVYIGKDGSLLPDPAERKKTLRYMRFAPLLGVIVAVVLILTWVVPYTISK